MIRFDVLPDEVLLDIFDIFVASTSHEEKKTDTEAWQLLVHVCRRWRSLVFESPRRLNLRLFCTPETRVRDALDTWPVLPLIIDGYIPTSSGMDNIIAALGHSNRVCQLTLYGLADWKLERVSAMMQVPFPELTGLVLSSCGVTPPVIPDSFLGGSAPRLRSLTLEGIPFPGLPKVLLSSTHLVKLCLQCIPASGYVSPEAMVPLLFALSSLRELSLEFLDPPSRSDWETRSPPPPERSILPTLTHFFFEGATEYLEDFVTMIDAPQLNNLDISFLFHIDYRTQRLAQFINRTPKLGKCDAAHIKLDDWSARVLFGTLEILIPGPYMEPVRWLSCIAQLCNFSLLSTVEDLYIEHPSHQNDLQGYAIDNTLCLQLFLPYTAVKNLYLSKEFWPGVAAALQEFVGARITEVLPSLQNIFVEELQPSGPMQDIIGQFVAARQLSGHPIAISDWHDDFKTTFLDSDDDSKDNDSNNESM